MSVLCVGYPTLDHIASVVSGQGREQTRYITHHWLEPTPGGCACNVAVGLARLGHRAAVQFTLGDDQLSDWFIKQLKTETVDISRISRQAGASVPKVYMFISDQVSEVFFDPAGIEDRPQTLDLTNISHLLITVAPPEATLGYFDQANRAGVQTIWQLKLDPQAISRDILMTCIGKTDLLFCNQQEFEYLQDFLGKTYLEGLLLGRLKSVVITRGHQGSEVLTAEGSGRIPIVPAQTLDTTGAGDAFTAGFIHGLLEGESLETCANFGAKAASRVVGFWGSQAGLPTRESFGQ